MIKTREPEVFDPIDRKVSHVFIRVGPKKENDDKQSVQFLIEFFYIKSETRVEPWPFHYEQNYLDENGEEQIMQCTRFEDRLVKRNYLIPFKTRVADYKYDTFYKHFSDLRPENRYQFAINEIDRINKIPDRDEYYFEWTKDDLEIISEDEIIRLFEPTLAEEENE